jgi:uncharacterized protein (TIGR00251 family)
MSNKPAAPPIDIRTVQDEVRLHLHVQPKASRNQIRVESDGRIKVTVTAAPSDGEANAAVCQHLADHFGVSKSSVRVVQGETSRNKVVGIRGCTPEHVRAKLLAVIKD